MSILGVKTARLGVVVSGAMILIIETLAARLVAPYVGLTLEATTAAIGVALLGIAVGASLGGRLADRYPPRHLAGGALMLGGLLTLLVRPIITSMGDTVGTGTGAAIFLISLSTLPPVLVLGMVAPIILKGRIDHEDQQGRLIGNLSALGTIGSLGGTFLTGYVLVQAAPLQVVMVTVGIIGVTTGLVILGRGPRRVTTSILTLLLAGGGIVLTSVVQDGCYDTTYHCARVETDPARPSGRVLYLDDLAHSYVDLDDKTHLEYPITRRMRDVIDANTKTGPLHVLYVGGGGYTMVSYLETTRPGSTHHVLEIDAGVAQIAREKLDADEVKNLTETIGDARVSMRDVPSGTIDVIVMDAFGSLSVPWHLTTREYLQDTRRVMKDDGVMVMNLADGGELKFLSSELLTLQGTYAHTSVTLTKEQGQGQSFGSYLLAASGQALKETPGGPDEFVTKDGRTYQEELGGGTVLRDDYAPVDQLLSVP